VIVLEGDRDPITAGRTETLGRIHPGPAADDTVTAIDCSPLRAVRWRSIVSVVIAVLDPLRDTAVHIVEPKVIRLVERSATFSIKPDFDLGLSRKPIIAGGATSITRPFCVRLFIRTKTDDFKICSNTMSVTCPTYLQQYQALPLRPAETLLVQSFHDDATRVSYPL